MTAAPDAVPTPGGLSVEAVTLLADALEARYVPECSDRDECEMAVEEHLGPVVADLLARARAEGAAEAGERVRQARQGFMDRAGAESDDLMVRVFNECIARAEVATTEPARPGRSFRPPSATTQGPNGDRKA